MRRSLIGLCLCLLFVAACEKSVVYGDLKQDDANEILVLLNRHGVAATLEREVRQNIAYYSVVVQANELDRARTLLNENNLPHQKKPGLADIFTDTGPIPSPEEQKARFLLALKGEIVNSLERIPDVVEADVIVNVPNQEGLDDTEQAKRSTAAVVLKVRPTEQALATLTEGKIQRFVANTVEKLDPRDVSVIITYTGPANGGIMPGQQPLVFSPGTKAGEQGTKTTAPASGDTISVAGVTVSPDSAGRLKLYLGLFLGLLALLSVSLVAMVVQASRMRQEMREMREHPALESGMGAPPPQLNAGESGEL